MDPVIFIDPGYGKDWEFTGGERINSNGKPANPYARISFRGENCTAVCTGRGFGYAMPAFENNQERQRQCKVSVYCKDMASGGAFSIGLNTSSTAAATYFLGITIGNGSYEIQLPSGITPSSGTLTGSISDGYHNISFMFYESKIATNSYTLAYRIAIDDKYVYATQTVTSLMSSPYLVARFPPVEAGKFFISNVIVAIQGDSTISLKTCDKQIIPPNTQLMPLKLGEPEDITFEKLPDKDGEYIGYSSGDKLFQTIDATDLIDGTTDPDSGKKTKAYGENAKVDTVVAYGNPGYRTVDFNKNIYGSFDGKRSVLSASVSKTPGATCCVELPARNTTLGEINGKLAGWEIG